MSYLLVQGQQSMTLDARRNQAYADALAKVITPDSVVLDLGAGLGIHGLMAAQMGAKRVYLVEPEDIIAVAQEIALTNGYGDRVRCLQGKIEDVVLPEPVDVIISVFTGNFLLEEDLLPSLFYARDKYLKPGGVMIPEAAEMEAVPVTAPALYQSEIETWSRSHHGIDHSPARAYASQSIYYYRKELSEAQYLAAPQRLMAIDFHHATSTDCQVELTYPIKEAGICHGWAGWFKMRLGDTWLSTAPHEPPLHWSAAFLPLDPPLPLSAGDTARFRLQRPPHGDWSWRVQMQGKEQQRSTFFAVPMTLKTLRRTAADYHPQLNPKGKAAALVLSHCDGSRSLQEIGADLLHSFPEVFADEQQALKFAQSIAACYG